MKPKRPPMRQQHPVNAASIPHTGSVAPSDVMTPRNNIHINTRVPTCRMMTKEPIACIMGPMSVSQVLKPLMSLSRILSWIGQSGSIVFTPPFACKRLFDESHALDCESEFLEYFIACSQSPVQDTSNSTTETGLVV